MIRFVHGADLHLDSPFHLFTAEKAKIMRTEQRELLRSLVALCNQKNADFLLLSGDIFDSANVKRDTLDALHEAFSECQAEICITAGNHDFLAPASPWLTEKWSENVHIFTNSTIESIFFAEKNCRIYGASFTTEFSAPLLEHFRPADATYHLMVLHGDTKPSTYNPITEAQIAQSGLDYLALGHVHSFQTAKIGKTRYAYPGCAMGRGFDETGEKGVICGTVDENGCEIDFVPLAKRQYRILTASPDAVTLPEAVQNDCCRLLLEGEADHVDTNIIYEQLKNRCFYLEVLDRTIPTVDLWSACGENSLKGLFLQQIHAELSQTTDEAQRQLLQKAARLGLDLIENREVQLP